MFLEPLVLPALSSLDSFSKQWKLISFRGKTPAYSLISKTGRPRTETHVLSKSNLPRDFLLKKETCLAKQKVCFHSSSSS